MLDQLRAATHALHARLDAGPYARAVRDRSLTPARFARFARALLVLHEGIEQVVERASERARAAYAHGPARRARLERDVATLGIDRLGVDEAVLHALVLVQRVRRDMADEAALLGYLYVLEGSQLGGLVQARHLDSEYLAGAGRGAKAEFEAFVAHLRGDPDVAAAAAVRAFEAFERMTQAVMRDADWMSQALNVSAGDHAVPSDLREVQAALAAGEQSIRDWPYYVARYGERGRGFIRSDSAWLATVGREEPVAAARQLAWLGRLLAARGMPRYLFEQHLRLLHDALRQAVPERRYDPLALEADRLAAERRTLIDDATFDALGTNEHQRLVLAACIDDAFKIPNALPSVLAWVHVDEAFVRSCRSALAPCP